MARDLPAASTRPQKCRAERQGREEYRGELGDERETDEDAESRRSEDGRLLSLRESCPQREGGLTSEGDIGGGHACMGGEVGVEGSEEQRQKRRHGASEPPPEGERGEESDGEPGHLRKTRCEAPHPLVLDPATFDELAESDVWHVNRRGRRVTSGRVALELPGVQESLGPVEVNVLVGGPVLVPGGISRERERKDRATENDCNQRAHWKFRWIRQESSLGQKFVTAWLAS